MSIFKLKINVNLPQFLYIVVSVVQNGEFERFEEFCVDCFCTFLLFLARRSKTFDEKKKENL